MPSNINTTISNITDYYDINKQLLPPEIITSRLRNIETMYLKVKYQWVQKEVMVILTLKPLIL